MRIFRRSLQSRLGVARSPLNRGTAWWIALICAAIGVLSAANLIIIPALAGYVSWIVLGGLILLLIANR